MMADDSLKAGTVVMTPVDMEKQMRKRDLVEVVRCIDCRFSCDHDDDDGFAWCNNWLHYVDYDHFCGHGERRKE